MRAVDVTDAGFPVSKNSKPIRHSLAAKQATRIAYNRVAFSASIRCHYAIRELSKAVVGGGHELSRLGEWVDVSINNFIPNLG